MSPGMQSAAAYASLYKPTSHEMIRCIPEIGERLLAQLNELSCRPTPSGAENMALQLEGVRLHILKIRESLVREAGARVPDVEK